MRFIDHLICFIAGHSERIYKIRLWRGLEYELGSLHCSRCGRAVGEYRRRGFEETETRW